MKALILFIIIIHGLIHLIGFIREWNLAPVAQFSGSTLFPLTRATAHVAGILWLVVCLLFLSTATIYLLHKDWWWIPATAAILVSQTLLIFYWPNARWGTIANVLLLIATVVSFGQWQLNKTVKTEVEQIFAHAAIKKETIITNEMLSSLPQPVQLWLTNSGVVGKEAIHTVRLKQKGLMRTKPGQEKWVAAKAEQYITVPKPAFVWNVKMDMVPLVPVTGRDKFIEGKGQILIKLMSLVPIVNSAGEKLDQGALQRYLAEICFYPSAALSPYIQWEAIDASSAKATLTYQGASGSVVFYFNRQGDMIRCTADRYMGGGNNATLEKWEVRSIRHATLNGVRIPVQSEATWKLKSGDFTWYKLEITEVEYNQPTLY